MGSNVSFHKSPDSAMKFRLSMGSKTKKPLILSPTKETSLNGEVSVAESGFKSQSSVPTPLVNFLDMDSKEEAFFDSQAWLESDCEDDFLSVNGDFTPSRDSTLNQQSSFKGLNKSLVRDKTPNYKPEAPSPTDKKKKLSELLSESFGDDEVFDDDRNTANGKIQAKATNVDLLLKSMKASPCVSKANSTCSSERTPSKISKPEKEKLGRTTQCCLPSLVTSLSFKERNKRLSPGRSGGG